MNARPWLVGMLFALAGCLGTLFVCRALGPARALDDGGPPMCGVPGDIDGDGRVSLVDVIHLFQYIFSHGPPPAACPADCELPGTGAARVIRVIDGDTIELEGGQRVRYIGINAPEVGEPFSAEATELNRHLVEGRTVGLEFDIERVDRYGRTLAYVWAGDTLVNLELIGAGYALVYLLPPNLMHDAALLAAEQEARKARRGLWAQVSPRAVRVRCVEFNAPGDDNRNKNGEWVEIENTGTSPVNLKGWSLRDEGNPPYVFGDLDLGPGAVILLHSGAGRDTGTKLYWDNQRPAIWNNDGDTAFLRDPSGTVVDSYSYSGATPGCREGR